MHALLLDGAFVCRQLRAELGEFPSSSQVLEYCEGLSRHRVLVGTDLLRIYFYDAPPATEKLIRPLDGREINFSKSIPSRQNQTLQRELEQSPNVALRLGELQKRGWKVGPRATRSLRRQARALCGEDFVPDFSQKGVDLRIGLDIARLSLGRLVRKIVLVTGDSDFIPAMKFARREGIQVYLDTMNQAPRHELMAHSDYWFGCKD
jgi:uncharacterized LabA/DUF88 family protein